jgi:hypothetical protein
MNRQYTGGLFWDILLITEYNKDWIDFFNALVKVLPCAKCREETQKYHEWKPLPEFSDTDEKNRYLWSLRFNRGGENWRKDVKENGYTLESWVNQFKDLPFSRIKK